MGNDLELIFKKYRSGRREELIPLLQDIQEHLGYLSEESIIRVGRYLGLSTTKIYGLATFYDRFRFIPSGRIHIQVCNGTSCFLNGSGSIISRLNEETGIGPGETSRDGSISYEIVSCMGGCNNGPLLNVNGEYYTRVRPEQLPEMLRKLKYVMDND